MRPLLILLLVAAAACSKAPGKTEAEVSPEITFDGAQITQAAARTHHGERIAWALGCHGCHGANLQGQRFYERYASNLTRDLPSYSDAEIERVLRTGVPHDGRELWAMPSEIFQHLSHADVAALIAHLRTAKPGGPPTQAPLPWADDAKALIAKGELKSTKDTVAHDRGLAPPDLGPQHALGRYITMVTCAECHGPELKGQEGDTPDLVVAGGYTRDEFETLLTKGIPTGGRKLALMAQVARKRFSHLTPHERDALYAYLKARAEQPQ